MLKDNRIAILGNLATGILDMQMARNPLASEVVLVFVNSVYDQYQDATVVETDRVKKYGMVKKNVDMEYVQELGDILVEDDLEHLPWLVSVTMTGLPRQPRQNDQILVDGLLYTISAVRPMNRNMDTVVNLFFYPERVVEEPLDIRYVSFLNLDGTVNSTPQEGDSGILDIVYCGGPKQLSFDNQTWVDFASRVAFQWPSQSFNIYLTDGSNIISHQVVIEQESESEEEVES